MIDKVRALHVPDECAECGEGYVAWPCPTAEIVYEPDEIKAILDAVVVSRKAQAKAAMERYAARKVEIANGSPLTPTEQLVSVADIWGPTIAAQLAASPIFVRSDPRE